MAVVQIPNLPAAIALTGNEEMEAVQSGSSVRVTVTQIAAQVSGTLGVTVGSTSVFGGSSGNILYDNAGVVGELTVSQLGSQLSPYLSVTIGSTSISSGASGSILYDNAGEVGELTVSQLASQVNPFLSVSVNSTAITGGASGRLVYDNAGSFGEIAGVTSDGTTVTFAGSSSKLALVASNIVEKVTVSSTPAAGTINYDVTTQSVVYLTANASGNWTVNFRASSGATLDSAMVTGQSLTVAMLVTQGSPAYYNNAVTVDGSSVTPKWQGGSAPLSGNASSVDAYTYAIIKTGAATFDVFASKTRFA